MARSKTTEGSTVTHLMNTQAFKKRLTWVACAGFTAVVLAALVSFDSADWPSRAVAVHNAPSANLLGDAGAAVAYWTYGVLGFGVWTALVLATVALVATARSKPIGHWGVRVTGAAMLVLATSSIHALWFPTLGPVAGMEAGMLPQWVSGELGARFSGFASSIILLCAVVIGAIVAADEVVFALPGAVMRGLSFLEPVWQFDYAAFAGPLLAKMRGAKEPALAMATPSPAPANRTRLKPANVRVVDASPDDDEEGLEEEEVESKPTAVAVVEVEDEDSVDEDADESEEDEDDSGASGADTAESEEEEDDAAVTARAALSAEELREKIARLPVRMANAPKVAARDEDIPRAENYEGYQFPTLDLLEDPQGNHGEQMEEFVRSQAQKLEQTLQTYEIEGEVTGIESGPCITLYSVELAPGTRAARLQTIATDIARALSAPNVRILPNMVGRTSVGIEVPNKHKEMVRLKELMSGPAAGGMALPMFLGKDSSGEPMVIDLAKQPHMLIAGTTGSGKSVCMNTIIMSWLYTKRPDELKLCLVDPKMVEMSQFSDIPHLMCPVITDMDKAAGILEWAVNKMEERYELLRSAGVKDLRSYNELGEEELKERIKPAGDLQWARTPKKLPYMVFVVDELADLMLQHREVETFIVRIAQKARAVGMHLVLATQRPQANVVTGLIKSNMPCRVSFKVASAMDSRIVLDHKGGELLLGHGDMLVVTPVTSDVRRAQGTLVTDKETRGVAKFLKEVAAPTFERTLIAIKGPGADAQAAAGGEGGGLAAAERDPLFDRAVEIVIESGRGSVSLLQRRMAIGYGRASRLVDQMGQAGIVGEHKGAVHRDVLISMKDWDRMKAMEANPEGGEASGDVTEPTTAGESTHQEEVE